MDFGEESDVVTNELTDEDDIGFKVIRSLFFIGEFWMRNRLNAPSSLIYAVGGTATPHQKVWL